MKNLKEILIGLLFTAFLIAFAYTVIKYCK